MPLTSLKAKSMNAAKQAMYTPQQLTAGARNARWAKLLMQVDPTGQYSDAERNRRADALLRSQMLALVDARERKRKAAKAQAADAAINAIVYPLLGCALCGPLAPNVSHQTCNEHKAEMKQRLSR